MSRSASLLPRSRRASSRPGGEPIEFNTIGMCDGVAQGHAGMRYCLPHREIIADSCEAMIVGEGCFDGVVYMGSCDKIVPAMLMAAARINLPAALVTAGPCYDEIKPSESKALRARFLRGEATEREVIEGTLKYYTGPASARSWALPTPWAASPRASA